MPKGIFKKWNLVDSLGRLILGGVECGCIHDPKYGWMIEGRFHLPNFLGALHYGNAYDKWWDDKLADLMRRKGLTSPDDLAKHLTPAEVDELYEDAKRQFPHLYDQGTPATLPNELWSAEKGALREVLRNPETERILKELNWDMTELRDRIRKASPDGRITSKAMQKALSEAGVDVATIRKLFKHKSKLGPVLSALASLLAIPFFVYEHGLTEGVLRSLPFGDEVTSIAKACYKEGGIGPVTAQTALSAGASLLAMTLAGLVLSGAGAPAAVIIIAGIGAALVAEKAVSVIWPDIARWIWPESYRNVSELQDQNRSVFEKEFASPWIEGDYISEWPFRLYLRKIVEESTMELWLREPIDPENPPSPSDRSPDTRTPCSEIWFSYTLYKFLKKHPGQVRFYQFEIECVVKAARARLELGDRRGQSVIEAFQLLLKEKPIGPVTPRR